MSLPKLETPKYALTIPSTKKNIEFRPYLVGEEKILMLAMESEDERQIGAAVKDIIRVCTFGKVNPDDLTSTDLEYLFLKLRAKSVGETVTVKLKCQYEPCDGEIACEINIDKIEPTSANSGVSNRIALTDKIGITLRPATVRNLTRLSGNKDSGKAGQINALIAASIESIYDDQGVYRSEDSTIEELTEFIDSLSAGQLNQIKAYFESLPRLSKDLKYACPKCKCLNELTLSGLQSFFV